MVIELPVPLTRFQLWTTSTTRFPWPNKLHDQGALLLVLVLLVAGDVMELDLIARQAGVGGWMSWTAAAAALSIKRGGVIYVFVFGYSALISLPGLVLSLWVIFNPATDYCPAILVTADNYVNISDRVTSLITYSLISS